VVPAAALMMLADGTSLYVVDEAQDRHPPQGEDAAHLRHQGRGERRRAGEQVVIEGSQNVRPGGKVRVDAKGQAAEPRPRPTGAAAPPRPTAALPAGTRGVTPGRRNTAARARKAHEHLGALHPPSGDDGAAVCRRGGHRHLCVLQHPVAALPSYNTPVINVNAQLPGASPDTMASSVALPLEKQFSTIPACRPSARSTRRA
jgi:hypothetical protein